MGTFNFLADFASAFNILVQVSPSRGTLRDHFADFELLHAVFKYSPSKSPKFAMPCTRPSNNVYGGR